MRNPRHYSGWATLLIWLGLVVFSITFWAGLSCLIGTFLKV